MKYRKLLLILAIATLSLTACKKEQNPAPAENMEETTIDETTTNSETDESMDTITNADHGAANGVAVDAPVEETQEETKEYEHISGSGEVTDELAADNEKYKDATSSDDIELTEEEKQQVEAAVKRQEELKNNPDAPDPSLTQEDLDKLDAILDDLEEGSGYTMCGRSDDPNSEGGVKYYGDDHVRDWD